MGKPNIESESQRLAERIAVGLNCVPGEHVRISGGIHQYDLLSRIAFFVSSAGAYPDIHVISDESVKRMTAGLPEDYLDRPSTQHDRYMAALYDAEIVIQALQDEKLFAGIPLERMKLGQRRSQELSQIAKARSRRVIIMGWPTKQKAASCRMSHVEFEKLFLDALFTDVENMNALGGKVWEMLSHGGEVHIHSDKGTDLVFQLESSRRVMIDAGCFDRDMVLRGDITKNLPCGEVYTTAVEETVEGTAVFDLTYVHGSPVKDLRLVFEKGRITRISAASGVKLFRQAYDSAVGDKDRIGEFGIGINPALTKPIGHSLLDEKIFGSIHLALGENRMYGGVNESSMHWDLVMLASTVRIRDRMLLNKGQFDLALMQ